jgi:glycosyltransferase involved in cell wall biosynthesis
MNKKPLVTIIIPTRNSKKYLGLVFKSIQKQTYQNIEIILVDNNSTDNTKKIATKYTNNIYNKGPERSPQKNFGARKAKGKYILILDSDAELTKNVVKECVEISEKELLDMVIIPEKHVGTGFWTHSKALERECFLGDDTVECPWFFKKTSFLKSGGYNKNLYAGEDWELFERMKKMNYKYNRNQSFIHHHLGHLRYWEMVKKKYYYGKNLAVYIEKSSNSSNKIPFLRTAYLKNWKKLITHPFLTCGFVSLKIGESFFVLLGILNYKIKYKKNG